MSEFCYFFNEKTFVGMCAEFSISASLTMHDMRMFKITSMFLKTPGSDIGKSPKCSGIVGAEGVATCHESGATEFRSLQKFSSSTQYPRIVIADYYKHKICTNWVHIHDIFRHKHRKQIQNLYKLCIYVQTYINIVDRDFMNLKQRIFGDSRTFELASDSYRKVGSADYMQLTKCSKRKYKYKVVKLFKLTAILEFHNVLNPCTSNA
ncbi:hypothetical protein WN51_10819 [Melipona quadrifasciata]|uniref:Uncharacterized protein n=1 Tax=Melipona quadrifasciata TaxID=166423 RepID=A0A0M9A6K0_9HYME|nr:hypothetical protein WN51_10819 [Melipona quadrifasciata]